MIFCFIIALTSQFDMHKNIITAYRNGQYETAEGYVENFTPQPIHGHATEHFEIDGVQFVYSEHESLQGYNATYYKGGVVRGDGQQLRIRYIPYEPWDRNVIVQIEEIVSIGETVE